MKSISGIFLFLVVGLNLLGQHQINGVIRDQKSKSPLPFVHVMDLKSKQVVTSNIDGKFEIQSMKSIDSIQFSYVGYEPKVVLGPSASETYLMIKKQVSLKAHDVYPGINPAHRIIELAYANSDRNNPEVNGSFEYDTYMKMKGHLNFDEDAVSDTSSDSTILSLMQFMETSDLFIMETVTNRKFTPPNHSKEVILGTKVSGFKNPDFGLITSQMGSFTFYDELFAFGDKEYLNPISKNSTKKYLFILEDSTLNGEDTTFIISFRPRQGRNFEALQGVMYINSNGYALENVLAQPFEYQEGISMNFQQAYELVDNRKWFPSEINTDFTIRIDSNDTQFDLEGKLKGYFLNIKLDPVHKKKEFSHVAIELDPMATKQADAFWSEYRVDSLTPRERTTYQKVDSVSKELNIERNFFILNSLLSGIIPYRFLDLELNKIARYNRYEGLGLGLGLRTNTRFSKHVFIGGYFNYGIGDETWKYGGDLAIHPLAGQDLAFKLSYMKDVVEVGGVEWDIKTRKGFSSASLRPMFISWKDERERTQVAIQFRTFDNLQAYFFGNYDFRTTTDDVVYFNEDGIGGSNFETAEIGVQIRYAYGENYLPINGRLFSLGTDAPIIHFKYTMGVQGILNSEFDYHKINLKALKLFKWRSLGKTYLSLSAGWTDANLPRTLLYNAPSSYYNLLPVEVDQSFQTMRANEFFSDAYGYFFFKHVFLNIKTKAKWFRPAPVIYHNMGLGLLSDENQLRNSGLQGFEDGYFESGFGIDYLYSQNNFGIGINAMYRYGRQELPYYLDNWSLKLTAGIKLDFGSSLNME